jgi:hypothetical protein
VDNAVNVVEAFVAAHVSSDEMSALGGTDRRAPREDVSKRVPPNGAAAAIVQGPVLDYAKLAQAILSEQRKIQQGEIES